MESARNDARARPGSERETLATALRAEGARLRGAGTPRSRAARARNAWERWVDGTLGDTAEWVREARAGVEWDEEAGLTGSVAGWIRARLRAHAEQTLECTGAVTGEEVEEGIERARGAVDAYARALCARAYGAPSVECGRERLGAMGEGDEARGRGRVWPRAVSIAALEQLGQARAEAVRALESEAPWLRRAALEGAARRGDPQWLDAGAERWMREEARAQAKALGLEPPPGNERMRETVSGWPGRHHAPPLALARVAQRTRGGTLEDADWAAAQEIAARGAQTKPGEARETILARALGERAQRVHEEVRQRVRRGTFALYSAEALETLERRWAGEPALARRAGPRPARLEEHEDGWVAWTVEYDSAERIACAAWARAVRPSEEMRGHWALRLRVGGFEIAALLENAPRAGTAREREPDLPRRVRAVARVEEGVRTRWDR